MKQYKNFVYLGLTVLFVTTFPMCLGYLPFGAFRPRALLLLASFILAGSVWNNSISKKFIAFAAYVAMSWFIFNRFTIEGFGANFMEYAIPVLLFIAVIRINDYEVYKKVAYFAVFTTLLTMAVSIVACSIYPDAIRGMVGAVASGDFAKALVYQRTGVCSYGFAAMMMVVAPICVGLAKQQKNRRTSYLLLGIAALSYYFLYIAGTTTPLLISLLMTALTVIVKKMTFKHIIFASVVITVIVPFALSVLSSLSIFAGTNFESRLADVSAVASGGVTADDSDLDTRNELIGYSLSAFGQSPVFGSFNTTTGGHNYYIDFLAHYGIFGTILYVIFFVSLFKMTVLHLTERYKSIYMICVVSLIMIGVLKWCSGIEYWLYTFFYIPCMLIYLSKKEAN